MLAFERKAASRKPVAGIHHGRPAAKEGLACAAFSRHRVCLLNLATLVIGGASESRWAENADVILVAVVETEGFAVGNYAIELFLSEDVSEAQIRRLVALDGSFIVFCWHKRDVWTMRRVGLSIYRVKETAALRIAIGPSFVPLN